MKGTCCYCHDVFVSQAVWRQGTAAVWDPDEAVAAEYRRHAVLWHQLHAGRARHLSQVSAVYYSRHPSSLQSHSAQVHVCSTLSNSTIECLLIVILQRKTTDLILFLNVAKLNLYGSYHNYMENLYGSYHISNLMSIWDDIQWYSDIERVIWQQRWSVTEIHKLLFLIGNAKRSLLAVLFILFMIFIMRSL